MAIGIYFDGRRLIRPQAATKIDDTGMYARGLGGANILGIIGESTGGEPGKVMWFTDPSYAKTILKSGPLVKALQRAYDPSADVSGAYMVGVIRVNHFTSDSDKCTPATLALRDVSYNPLILLTSVDWGVWNNQIKVRIENGTSGGKKATITYGTTIEQGDSIKRQSIFLAIADPLVITATYSVSKSTGKLTTSVASKFQGVLHYAGAGSWTNNTPAAYPGANNLPVYMVGTNSPPNDYIYIGSDQPFSTVPFVRGSGTQQVEDSVLSGEYWNGSAWTALAAFVDGTKATGKPFTTNGSITFTLPSAWAKTPLTALVATVAAPTPWDVQYQYWIRLKVTNTLTSDAKGHTLTLTRGLDITLSQYPTIQELIDYIDTLHNYEAGAITTKPTTELSTQLDDATNVDMISGGNTTLSDPYNPSVDGTTIKVGSTTNFAIGDYITVSYVSGGVEEARRVTSLGTGTLGIDSQLSTTYGAGSIVREAVVLNSDLQALIDWFNIYSSFITAAYHTSAVNRATVNNIPDTYLTGGSDGITTQADWDAALALLQTEDTNLITCVTTDPAVWASLSAHCSYMSTVGKKERIGFCGGFYSGDGYTDGLGKWNTTSNINSSIQSMLNYAQQLNSDRMVYAGPGFSAYDEEGNLTTYNGAYAAALVSGMAAGVDVAEALTHKSIKVIGLEYNLRWADLDRLLEGGVCPLEYDPGHGYRVCQSITTWLRNDKYNRRELSVRRTADYVARQVRERLERDFVGSKGTKTTLISIKNATISVLTQCVRLELLAGDAANPPFKNIQCRLEGDTCYVDFECSPVIPINYIPITIHLTVFTTTVTG